MGITETPSRTSSARDRLRRLARPWPAVAGLAVAGATAYGASGGAEVAPVVTASGFVYLGAAALRTPRAAWPVFAGSFVLVGLGFAVPALDPSWLLLGAVALLVAFGLTRGAARPPWGVPLQGAAMIVLAATALAAAQLGGAVAGVLVAAALLAHAAWDAYHHRVRRVVVRSMAEFCAVLDTALACLVLWVTFA